MQRGITCQGRLIISESGDLGRRAHDIDDNDYKGVWVFNEIHWPADPVMPGTAHPARSWCKFLQVFTKQSITRSNEMYYNVLQRIALYSLYSQHELLPPLHLIYL